MTDPQEVKIVLTRSWEKETKVETKWVQIPKKVPKDRLFAPQRDRKLKLWLECHIGSEKIKTFQKVGHYRLSPLGEFQKEENLPEQMLQDEAIKSQRGFGVNRIVDAPFTGIAVSTHGNWRIEQAIKDGELESPIIFYKNSVEVFRREFVKSTNPIRRTIPPSDALSPTTPPVATVIGRPPFPSSQPAEVNGMSAEEKENKAVAESNPEGTEGSAGESTPQIYRPPIPPPDGGGQ